jgi:hypothetical protein
LNRNDTNSFVRTKKSSYLPRVERIYPTRGRLKVKINLKAIRVEKENDGTKIDMNGKTRMM